MRLTIIVDENRVNVEGQSETVDCTAFPDLHVVQWYGTYGEIEYFNPPGAVLKANTAIDDISPFQYLIDAWTVEAQKPLVTPVVKNAA